MERRPLLVHKLMLISGLNSCVGSLEMSKHSILGTSWCGETAWPSILETSWGRWIIVASWNDSMTDVSDVILDSSIRFTIISAEGVASKMSSIIFAKTIPAWKVDTALPTAKKLDCMSWVILNRSWIPNMSAISWGAKNLTSPCPSWDLIKQVCKPWETKSLSGKSCWDP